MIHELSDYLELKLSGELPGERAHVEMAPIKRLLPGEARKMEDTRYSGVLVLLYPHAGSIHTALMRRPDYGGVHSGQISFPGGRREPFDADIWQTALREAEEEMNISRDIVRVIGQMSELYIPPSKSLVTPVLGIAAGRPDFIPDTREVAEIIEADLFELLNEKSFGTSEIVTSSYLIREVPVINFNNHTIWGATAMILNEFRHLIRDFS